MLQLRSMLGNIARAASLVLLALVLGGQSVLAAEITIRADSPSQYTVVKGDTLWDIASKFLEEPWLWPQVWELNPQIENPDLIYPGDVIELSYENGSPVLRLSRTSPPDLPELKLEPRIHSEALLNPIPVIALEQISSVLSANSVITEGEFGAASYLVLDADGKELISRGDTVYARGEWKPGVTDYDIVRRGRELKDPDSGASIGLEAVNVGSARLESLNGDRALLWITHSTQEIKAGDRLLPKQSLALESTYLPRPPAFQVDAAIVSIGSGRSIGGLNDSLLINRGSVDGIEAGQVLAVREPQKSVRDKQGKLSGWQKVRGAFGADSGELLEFPGATVGTVLVYRVFEQTSLALVLESPDVIRLQDRVVTP